MRMARQTNIKSPGRLDSLARAEEKGAGPTCRPTRRAGGPHSCSAREEGRSLSSPPTAVDKPELSRVLVNSSDQRSNGRMRKMTSFIHYAEFGRAPECGKRRQ